MNGGGAFRGERSECGAFLQLEPPGLCFIVFGLVLPKTRPWTLIWWHRTRTRRVAPGVKPGSLEGPVGQAAGCVRVIGFFFPREHRKTTMTGP